MSGMPNLVSAKGHLKNRWLLLGAIVSGESHNCLLLLVSDLGVGYIICSPVLPQAHTNVNFIETHFHFI
jgi:hypothetical protein